MNSTRRFCIVFMLCSKVKSSTRRFCIVFALCSKVNKQISRNNIETTTTRLSWKASRFFYIDSTSINRHHFVTMIVTSSCQCRKWTRRIGIENSRYSPAQNEPKKKIFCATWIPKDKQDKTCDLNSWWPTIFSGLSILSFLKRKIKEIIKPW